MKNEKRLTSIYFDRNTYLFINNLMQVRLVLLLVNSVSWVVSDVYWLLVILLMIKRVNLASVGIVHSVIMIILLRKNNDRLSSYVAIWFRATKVANPINLNFSHFLNFFVTLLNAIDNAIVDAANKA